MYFGYFSISLPANLLPLKKKKVLSLFIYGCGGSWLLIFVSFSLVAASGSYPLLEVHGLLIAVASLVADHGL